jgi:acyl carrier protein|tara:strand:- start:940 stop:1182 length:243 start_codon:yes stop_codon:yes gene_type:complete
MKRLKRILSRVLEISENDITEETSPETVETWDSFNALLLVSELENDFNIKFTMDEVVAVKCVGDIKNSLKKHGVELDEVE